MIKDFFNSHWFNVALRFVLGLIFIYASIDKIRQPLEFARIIDAYELLPENLIGLVAAILPFLELICGILLVFGIWVLPSLVWIGVMLIVFMAGMIQAYFRGLAIDCGCFSVTGDKSGITVWTVLRDVLILLLWLKVFWYYKSPVVGKHKEAVA